MKTLLYLVIVIVSLLILDFFVENKFQIRKQIVNKLGIFLTIILIIFIVAMIDFTLINFRPELQENELYKYIKLVLFIYFLPRKGDKDEQIRRINK